MNVFKRLGVLNGENCQTVGKATAVLVRFEVFIKHIDLPFFECTKPIVRIVTVAACEPLAFDLLLPVLRDALP